MDDGQEAPNWKWKVLNNKAEVNRWGDQWNAPVDRISELNKIPIQGKLYKKNMESDPNPRVPPLGRISFTH